MVVRLLRASPGHFLKTESCEESPICHHRLCYTSLLPLLLPQGSGGSFNLSGSGDMFLGMPGLNGDSYSASQVRWSIAP